ncbi:MAG: glutaredoxin 3 [Steroidobacteraceae bacterium]
MNAATHPEVTMYSTGICPYCDRARSLLERKGVSISEIKVDQDPAQRDTMLKRSGGRRTVPQIFIGDRHVGGFDDLYALDKAGELDQLLGRT